MFFYGWWNPAYLLLLGLSVLANWSFGLVLAHCLRLRGDQAAGRLLWLGIAMNLLLIGYYKYAGFFAGSINGLAGTHFDAGPILLPLAMEYTPDARLVEVEEGAASQIGRAEGRERK